jgi:putative spermidine/putrescine transport system permease protein
MKLIRNFFFLLASLFLLLPVAFVILAALNVERNMSFPPTVLSLHWFEHFLSSKSWTDAIRTSFWIATGSSLLTVLIGIPAAVTLARSNSKIRGLAWLGLLCPIAIPLITQAVAFQSMFGSMHILDSKVGIILAHTLLALPAFVLNLYLATLRIDPDLEYAAINLGASTIQAFFTVTLRLLTPSLLVGTMLSFLISFDESVIALFIGGTRTITFPKRMWDGLRFDIDPTTSAAASLVIAFSVTLYTISLFFQRKPNNNL